MRKAIAWTRLRAFFFTIMIRGKWSWRTNNISKRTSRSFARRACYFGKSITTPRAVISTKTSSTDERGLVLWQCNLVELLILSGAPLDELVAAQVNLTLEVIPQPIPYSVSDKFPIPLLR